MSFIIGRTLPFFQTFKSASGATHATDKDAVWGYLGTDPRVCIQVAHNPAKLLGCTKTNARVIGGDHWLLFALKVADGLEREARELVKTYPRVSVGYDEDPNAFGEISLVKQGRLPGTRAMFLKAAWADVERVIWRMDVPLGGGR